MVFLPALSWDLSAGLGPKKTYTVCIDPGHPSEVGRGTQGKHLTEIHAAWEVAVLLRGNLEKQGIHVVLTKRSEGEFVKNRTRAEIANDANANLMVRLHCDASTGEGFTTYYPDQVGHSEGHTGPSAEFLKRERPIASAFQQELSRGLYGFLQDNGLKGDEFTAVGQKQGALTGSIFSNVPVVLVEMVVLTNPKDEAKISSQAGCMRLANALARATMYALKSEGRGYTRSGKESQSTGQAQ
jgi:N-acetylmuramoyl-L-alanine amidase